VSYHLAQSLKDLRAEIDKAHPGRDKSSDGWIGDTAHSARKSDHNPDYSAGGVVRAIDVDISDIDVNKLMGILKKDSRVEYFIYNSSIYGREKFAKRPYNGANPHNKHIHISISHTKAAEKGGAWGYSASKPAPSKPKPDTKPKPSKGKGWPAEPLPITSKHTAESDKAWRELMAAVGYKDSNLTTNIERWLKDLGYYKGIIEKDHGKAPVFGRMLVEALQRFLASKNLYKRAIDGNRQGHTVQAEIKYLNLPVNRGVK